MTLLGRKRGQPHTHRPFDRRNYAATPFGLKSSQHIQSLLPEKCFLAPSLLLHNLCGAHFGLKPSPYVSFNAPEACLLAWTRLPDTYRYILFCLRDLFLFGLDVFRHRVRAVLTSKPVGMENWVRHWSR